MIQFLIGKNLITSAYHNQWLNLILLYLVNGQWGFWSSWSACTETCGSGRTTRNRECNNPPPSNGGSFCDGAIGQNKHCMVEFCPG